MSWAVSDACGLQAGLGGVVVWTGGLGGCSRGALDCERGMRLLGLRSQAVGAGEGFLLLGFADGPFWLGSSVGCGVAIGGVLCACCFGGVGLLVVLWLSLLLCCLVCGVMFVLFVLFWFAGVKSRQCPFIVRGGA